MKNNQEHKKRKFLKKLVNKYRSLYDIGLHGADICLYYEPMSFNAVKKTCFRRSFFIQIKSSFALMPRVLGVGTVSNWMM